MDNMGGTRTLDSACHAREYTNIPVGSTFWDIADCLIKQSVMSPTHPTHPRLKRIVAVRTLFFVGFRLSLFARGQDRDEAAKEKGHARPGQYFSILTTSNRCASFDGGRRFDVRTCLP